MSNASTVRRQISGTQQLTIAPLVFPIPGTIATAFALNNNPLTVGGGYNGAPNGSGGGGVIPLAAGVTGLYQGTGRVLHVAAQGMIITTASENLTLALYEVPAALLPIADTLAGQQTFTGWNLIATSLVRALPTGGGTASFSFDARVQLDAAGNLQGEFTDEINSLVDVYAPTTAVVGLVGEADLNFVLVATQSASNAGTVATLSEFRLDLE